ncbi:adenosylcobinamide-GDP ribazoletransferase [Microvirga makkahensis]|uniref:Adenosylcobinamide-GDP ribazoletransferase n=1 Tax=Microvirga makkahensis TaxID=1128670 RepID=A0A7X3MVE5_9HYPH|nr:adenosylcobinamide-GDP ribazoletransferase [Microvirga makkahensis]MXQ13876.1 adenosylcobinamide-GDP ribazoletransferase [Microvirga makkahensis]
MSEQIEAPQPAPAGFWQAAAVDLAHCLRFYSRLPVPVLPYEQNAHPLPDFPRLVRVLPIAGLVLGLLPALALACAHFLALDSWLCAILAVAAATLTTGAFHEDGLADTADSFGGSTRERRLEIMRDSRIGSFGAAALFLTLLLRIAALAHVTALGGWTVGVLAVLTTAALSRTAGLMPLVFLPPARADGAAYAVGQPSREGFCLAAGLAGTIAVILGLIGHLPLSGIALMIVLSGLTGWGFIRLSARHLGGQTGDIAGATQQMAEVAAMLGLLTTLQP